MWSIIMYYFMKECFYAVLFILLSKSVLSKFVEEILPSS